MNYLKNIKSFIENYPQETDKKFLRHPTVLQQCSTKIIKSVHVKPGPQLTEHYSARSKNLDAEFWEKDDYCPQEQPSKIT